MARVALAGFGVDGIIRILDGDVVSEYPVGDGSVPSHLWWAPDGRELFFTVRARSQNDRTRKTVFGLDPEDGSVRELFPRTEGINHIHVSPNKSSMVFFRPLEYPGVGSYPAGELVISNLGDSHGRVLAKTDPALSEARLATRFGQPAFSPDGTRILFLRRGGSDPEGLFPHELWIVNVDGSDMRKVATFDLIHCWDWDPSGRFIAFQAFESPDQQMGLWVVSADDGKLHEIEAFAGLDEPEFKGWSPDGRWLTVSQTVGWDEYWVLPDLLGGPAR
jgi:Tol biopolymer transport system component